MKKNCKGCRRKSLAIIYDTIAVFAWNHGGKITKMHRDTRCADRDSFRAHREYKSDASPVGTNCLVNPRRRLRHEKSSVAGLVEEFPG